MLWIYLESAINWANTVLSSGRDCKTAKAVGGWGKISAFGVDVIEGHAKPPISITLDQVQDFSVQIDKIVNAIEQSKASEHEKTEAKFLLKKFLEHPLVTSILWRACVED
jgi:hypothetical protein